MITRAYPNICLTDKDVEPALHFLKCTLCLDPKERPSAETLIKHTLLKDIVDNIPLPVLMPNKSKDISNDEKDKHCKFAFGNNIKDPYPDQNVNNQSTNESAVKALKSDQTHVDEKPVVSISKVKHVSSVRLIHGNTESVKIKKGKYP